MSAGHYLGSLKPDLPRSTDRLRRSLYEVIESLVHYACVNGAIDQCYGGCCCADRTGLLLNMDGFVVPLQETSNRQPLRL